MTQKVDPCALVLRDALPWRGGDSIIDERLHAMATLVDHPMAVVTALRHRAVIKAPGSDDHHSVTIRNALVGGRDGDGGRTTWLAIGRAIQLRIEDIQDGSGDTELSGTTIEDARRHVHGIIDVWRAREARIVRAEDEPIRRTCAHVERDLLLERAVQACTGHISAALSMEGVTEDAFYQIVTSMHRPPSVEIRRSAAAIGSGRVHTPGHTQFPRMSRALEATIDPRLRGCMIGEGGNNHITLRPCVARHADVSPADAMETLRRRTDPTHSRLPVEFS